MGMVPFPFIAVAIVGAFASWIPLAYFARARATLSKEPRVSLIQDMGIQPKFREQQSNPLFADGRADRPEIVGTVARGRLDADDHMYRGYEFTNEIDPKTKKPVVKFFDGFPSGIKVDAKLLNRGQERFNIYCSACHGYDGYGHGVVNERGLELQSEEKGAWVAAANLTIEPAKSRAAGHIYNTINMGIRNMPGYGPQIPVEDRWAIVAYVKALQLSQDVATSLVSPEVIKQSEASGTAK
jgi:mono/diheme cytochrome c family protein